MPGRARLAQACTPATTSALDRRDREIAIILGRAACPPSPAPRVPPPCKTSKARSTSSSVHLAQASPLIFRGNALPCCVRREQRGAYTLRAYTRSKCTPAHPPPRACARKRAYSGHDKSGDGGVIYRQCLVGAPSSTATSSGCGRCSISCARAVRCASPLTSSCALPPRIHWKRAL